MPLDLEEIKRLCTEYLGPVPAYELAKQIWERVELLQGKMPCHASSDDGFHRLECRDCGWVPGDTK